MNQSPEYIIEFHRIGQQVKVSACDPVSGKEVSIIGPANTPQSVLSSLAIKKLHYVLAKNPPPEEDGFA